MKLYLGLIIAVNGASNGVGKASDITYDVTVQFDNGVFDFNNVTPSEERWDDQIEIRAAKVGSPVFVVDNSGDLHFFIRELPTFGECP